MNLAPFGELTGRENVYKTKIKPKTVAVTWKPDSINEHVLPLVLTITRVTS